MCIKVRALCSCPLISSWLAISSVRVSGALVCAGRLIRHAQKKYDVKSTLLTHKVQKKIAILWKVLSTTPLLRQLHACIWNADLNSSCVPAPQLRWTSFLIKEFNNIKSSLRFHGHACLLLLQDQLKYFILLYYKIKRYSEINLQRIF